jgi:hypothetical protein
MDGCEFLVRSGMYSTLMNILYADFIDKFYNNAILFISRIYK